MPPKSHQYSPSKVLEWLPHLSRNLLHFWDHNKKKIRPAAPSASEARQWRYYTEDQLAQLALLDRCYALNLTPDFAAQVLDDPQLLRRKLADPIVQPFVSLLLELAMAVRSGDEAEFWRVAARGTAEVLHAESCGVWHQARWLAYHAAPGAPDGLRGPALTPELAESWLEQFQKNRRPVNLRAPAVAERFPGAPELRSLLARPLAPKGREVHWLVCCNRRHGGQPANAASLFDPIHEAILDLVAAWVRVAHVQFLLTKTFAPSRDLLSGHRGLRPMLQHLLEKAVDVTGAFRGDICFHDAHQDRLRLEATAGVRADKGLPVGELLPNRSLCRAVFDERRTLTFQTLEEAPSDVFAAHTATQGEIAIPLLRPHQVGSPPLGVMNLEFDAPFAFGRAELATAELIAQQITLVTLSVEARDTIQVLFEQETERRESPGQPSAALTRILEDIHEETKIPFGMLFIANYQKGRLEEHASFGLPAEREPFAYDLEENALVTKVFREGQGYFTASPEDDRFVSIRGLDRFTIRGPVVVIPLRMGPLVVGAISLWSDRGAAAPNRATAEDLKPFANLAFTSWYSRDRSRTLSYLAGLLNSAEQQSARKRADLKATCDLILKALIDAGFDRSRIFRLRPKTQSEFELLGTAGSDPDSAYAQVYKEGIRQCDYVQFDNRLYARKIDPTAPDRKPDPNSALLLKPDDLPWVNAPIFVGKELFGYLAADNKEHRHPIRSVDVECVSIISVIAGRLIANALTEQTGGA